MSKIEKWIGRRFGRLVVVAVAPPQADGNRRVVCRCDCGGEKTTRPHNLRAGNTTSCGCYHRERVRQNQGAKTHGWSKTHTYRSWQHMRDRCLNPNNKAWARYGGRGIKVCERWSSSFENFLDDMGPAPSAKHSLGRKDHDKDYEPGNVAWQTSQEQAASRKGQPWTPERRAAQNRKRLPGEWVWRGKARPK